MKISQLDNDIYEIENVLSADNWKKVHAEFNPVYNNWVFKKKEFDQLPISERSTQTALFPTWGNIAKLVNDDGIGDNLIFLNTSVLVKFIAEKILQKRLELVRINTNIQYTGMESMYHQDGNDTEWTFLIFMSKFWEPNWGGEFVCWNDDDTYRGPIRIEYCRVEYLGLLVCLDHGSNSPYLNGVFQRSNGHRTPCEEWGQKARIVPH